MVGQPPAAADEHLLGAELQENGPRAKETRAARLGWWSLLGIPILVPIVIGKLPFGGPILSHGFWVFPRAAVLALLVLVAYGAWCIGVARSHTQLRTIPHYRWLVVVLVLAAASTVAAISPSRAFFGDQYLALGLQTILLLVMVFILIIQHVTNMKRLVALSWSVVAGGSIVAGVGLLQVLDLDPLGLAMSSTSLVGRAESLLGNPDFTGTYLVVPMVVAAALGLSADDTRQRVMAFTCWGLCLVTLANTLTRGAWIGALIGLGVLGAALARLPWARRALPGLLAALVGVGSAALMIGIPSRFLARLGDLTSASTAGGGRLILWQDAIGVIARYPILGTGPDSYRLGWYAARSLESMQVWGIKMTDHDPHSLPLLLTATLGVPAALAVLGTIASILVTSWRRALRPGSGGTNLLYSGWWAAAAGLLVAQAFAVTTLTSALILSLALAAIAAPGSRSCSSSPSLKRSLVLGAGGVLCSFLAVLSLVTLASDIMLADAVHGSSTATDAHSAARTAPWHIAARYIAASSAVDDALLALQRDPANAATAAARAESYVRELAEADSREYANHALSAYLAANRGVLGEPTYFARATEAARKALTIYPLSVESAYYKAYAEYRMGAIGSALETLEPLWDVDPSYVDAGLLYADLLGQQDRHDDALEILTTLEANAPEHPAVRGAIESLRPQQ
ncbi:MAG: O-antigen ligase family protein [Coriobacteriia bacterium]|nr:O-antigen ligase family protein [Coriobacteriia bacterium]